MAWNNLVNPRAITSRRRVVASALVYGLSLTVRFTSATGDETQAQAAQSANPMMSIMIKDGAQIFGPPKLRSADFLSRRLAGGFRRLPRSMRTPDARVVNPELLLLSIVSPFHPLRVIVDDARTSEQTKPQE